MLNKNITHVIGDYRVFVFDLLERLESRGINFDDYPIDHLCYRVSSISNYREMKNELMDFSQSYAESIHHGRPITKFVPREPLIFDRYLIDLIELPAPKDGIHYNDGLEHFEMVVPEFDEFKERYKHLWTRTEDSGPFNQPVCIEFDKGTVKFHKHSLIEVLRREGVEFVRIK